MKVADIYKTMDYGPALESRESVDAWLQSHREGFQLFIDGRWVEPKGAACFDSVNPANGEVLGKVAQAGGEDVNAAVAAARKAQPAWEKLGGHGRARYLYALARLLQKRARAFAVLESLDNGKPIRESRDIDIPLAIRHFYYHAGWAQLLESEWPGYKPVGVVGQIIPWNFPLLMAAWKIAPALAAGNCVVLKPAEYTSLSALMLAQLCEEAGLPAGVVNVITGDGTAGEQLVAHGDVDKLAFTGSTEVGRIIRERSAGSGKKLSLELGGKSPFIVFDDADLDSAVEGLVDAIWMNQGQVCCAGSRLLVQEGMADVLIDKIKHRMEKLRVGDPLDKGTDIGAIVDPSQKARIVDLVSRGVREGASLWQPDIACPDRGCYYPPTLLLNMEPGNPVADVEIFGPVLSVTTFRTQSEAVALANNTRYGLAASIWSESINRALDAAMKIKAGVVWINCTNRFDAACGFGGVRESGFGREGGMEGMREYLKPLANQPGDHAPAVVESQSHSHSHFPPQIHGRESLPAIDRTAKHYIGGKQVRADNGNTIAVMAADGTLAGRVAEGSRKDIRNAVEAAAKAVAWHTSSGHNRAQLLYFVAENLSVRQEEFCRRLVSLTGLSPRLAEQEVESSIQRLFFYAAWADKFDGQIHQPPVRGITLALNEPLGIIGIGCCDQAPLLAFVSLLAPALAMGNRVVLVPSPRYPLLATDFYQVLETSDIPAGVVNIVTGEREVLLQVLARHYQVDSVWYQGTQSGCERVERASAGNLKRTWVNDGREVDWLSPRQGQGRQFLREACEVKNIWVPYGE